jgi:hypothetical protein
MRFQPYNDARRVGEDNTDRLTNVAEAFEEELLNQRASQTAAYHLFSLKGDDFERQPTLRWPLPTRFAGEFERNNSLTDRFNGAFCRVRAPEERDTILGGRKTVGNNNQLFSGTVQMDGQSSEEVKVQFALIECPPNGTEAGQNREAHLHQRQGGSANDDLPPMVETEYVRKQDIWQVLNNERRNGLQIAIGQDSLSARHTFPLIFHTDSYPSGAVAGVKETWAIFMRQAIRRNVGWHTRLTSLLKDLREAIAQREGLTPCAQPGPEGTSAASSAGVPEPTLSDVGRYIRSLERKERFVELPSSQDLGQMLTELTKRQGGT